MQIIKDHSECHFHNRLHRSYSSSFLCRKVSSRDLVLSPEQQKHTGVRTKVVSMEGGLVKATTIMGILFFVISVALNMLG